MARLASALVGCAFLLTAMAAAAQVTPADGGQSDRQRVAGAELFRTYCVVCHGSSGRGDGALASSMSRKPSDLTKIAERNGGVYPAEIVFRTIDGRQPVRGHGGPDMPVWGDAFLRSRDSGTKESVKETIDSLVEYLAGIQLKPVH